MEYIIENTPKILYIKSDRKRMRARAYAQYELILGNFIFRGWKCEIFGHFAKVGGGDEWRKIETHFEPKKSDLKKWLASYGYKHKGCDEEKFTIAINELKK